MASLAARLVQLVAACTVALTVSAVTMDDNDAVVIFNAETTLDWFDPWRRNIGLATRVVMNIDFDDQQWHTIVFEMRADFVRIACDCRTLMAELIPELDFSLLDSSHPLVWLMQAGPQEKLLLGKVRQFKIKEGSYLRDRCDAPPLGVDQLTRSVAMSSSALAAMSDAQERRTAVELARRLQRVEGQLARLENLVDRMGVASTTTPTPTPTTTTTGAGAAGACPNCYEYVLHKANYLEYEFKRWRGGVQSVQRVLAALLLAQRGCRVNGSTVLDGGGWTTSECRRCVCHLGRTQCQPVGCRPPVPPCTRPTVRPGDCCPTCGAKCFFMGAEYDDGAAFFTSGCAVRCRCDNGNMLCAENDHHSHSHSPSHWPCPPLTCPSDKRVRSSTGNACCDSCAEPWDHCSSSTNGPCHANASCANQPTTNNFTCTCNDGFFGDGFSCFDIDECQDDDSGSSTGAGSDGRGPCGAGSRCINTVGSYRCECLPGYEKLTDSGQTCWDTISL